MIDYSITMILTCDACRCRLLLEGPTKIFVQEEARGLGWVLSGKTVKCPACRCRPSTKSKEQFQAWPKEWL